MMRIAYLHFALRKVAAPAITLCVLLSGCVVPRHMHVTEGTSPQNVDTNVRFRTTYYFRVFDYCWAARAETGDGKYQDIIPETDTLYRYRMTGKASALGSRIKFESGMLSKTQIEPFGTDVVYNADAGAHIRRTETETKTVMRTAAETRAAVAAHSEADQARLAALDRVETIAKLLATTTDEEVKAALRTAISDALADFSGKRAPMSDDQRTAIVKLQASIDAIDARIGARDPAPAPSETGADPLATAAAAFTKEMHDQIAVLRREIVGQPGGRTICRQGQAPRTGFQIMGPEGMRPFDQDQRLIMAMSTSAKPLTETLDEYSGRILKGRRNPAEELLPLARETTRIVETQRALDGVMLRIAQAGDAPPVTDDVFASAIAAFEGAPK